MLLNPNRDSKTPLGLAVEKKNKKIVHLIMENLAQIPQNAINTELI